MAVWGIGNFFIQYDISICAMCSPWRHQQLWLLWEPDCLLESSVQEYCRVALTSVMEVKIRLLQIHNACAATYTHAESRNLLIKFQTHH